MPAAKLANNDGGTFRGSAMPVPPTFATLEQERTHRKQRLAAAFRLFGKFGFSEGSAGHITVRDPERTDHFWVNPLGRPFGRIRVSDLVLVDAEGEVVEGGAPVNAAAFIIHSAVHAARPDVHAAAHTHSIYGRAWSALGRLLGPINQDACAFFEDHAVYRDYGGTTFALAEGKGIAEALEGHKACILQNHGLLTVGTSVDAAAWWFITMERSCQAQLLAEATGTPIQIARPVARSTEETLGGDFAGWLNFQPLYETIVYEQPDFLE